jgi:hypothetical protein
MDYYRIHIDFRQYIAEPGRHLRESRSGFAKSIDIRCRLTSDAVKQRP